MFAVCIHQVFASARRRQKLRRVTKLLSYTLECCENRNKTGQPGHLTRQDNISHLSRRSRSQHNEKHYLLFMRIRLNKEGFIKIVSKQILRLRQMPNSKLVTAEQGVWGS